MTIRHLQIFKTVCDCGGITAAAERLNVTQPSVSLAMRELEAFYGARLFDRMNRGVYPTEAGLLLRRYAEEILSSFEEAASVLRGGRAVRRCRVGVNVSVAETYLSSIVERIRRDAPDVELSVLVKNNAQIDEMLSENQIDFAIYDGATETGARVALPLVEECQAAVCAPALFEGDAMEPAELAKKPLLLRESGSGLRICVDAALSRGGYPYRVAAESNSTLALLELARAGLGFAVVPRPLAEVHCVDGQLRLVQIQNPQILRRYALVYHKGKTLTPAIQAVIQACGESAGMVNTGT